MLTSPTRNKNIKTHKQQNLCLQSYPPNPEGVNPLGLWSETFLFYALYASVDASVITIRDFYHLIREQGFRMCQLFFPSQIKTKLN